MKKMRLTILLLIVAAFACAQIPDEYVRGTLMVDTLSMREFLTLPLNPLSGYFVNVNGYPMWYTGSGWDTLSVGSSGGGSNYTFLNGLTESGDIISLGGDMTDNISITNGGSYSLFLGEADDEIGTINIHANSYLGLHHNGTFNLIGEVDANYMEISIRNTGKRFIMSDNSILIRDDYNDKGIEYYANYGANFEARSLIDKNYVDSTITANIVDFVTQTDIDSSIDAYESNQTIKFVDYTECAFGDTTNINIGFTLTDISILLHYTCKREMNTWFTQSGTVEVQYNIADNSVYYSSDYIGTDLGVDITADYSNSSIRLNIIVAIDNYIGENVFFDFKIVNKFMH
jgi:hypothetical protein